MTFSSTVPGNIPKDALLIDYLTKRFTYFNHDEWLERISAGAIALNGLAANAGDRVASGDAVAYDAGEFEEPPADLAYRIVYEDDWLLGVDKPGNLLVHRAGRSFRNNLIYQLRYVHVPPYPAAHTAHRIDRDTSGVVVVAKDAAAHAALGEAFIAGRVRKEYLAVTKGIPKTGTIDLPIGRSAGSAIPYKFCADSNGKSAATRILSVQPLGSGHALVAVQPVTGRTHQIRVHLAAGGTPILGDKLYGMSEAEYLAWRENPEEQRSTLPFHRHALHCASLTFRHPFTGKECRIEAEMPRDMRELVEKLSKEG